VRGPSSLGAVTRSAVGGVGVASLMRVLLFLAALGVVSRGAPLDPANPAAAVFRLATGEAGYRLFGVVMWAAAVTSVVGSAFTSVSFLRPRRAGGEREWRALVVAFIALSTAVLLAVGQPVRVLVVVGALNGLILPLALGTMLVAAHRPAVVGDYRHPWWLTAAGGAVSAAMAALGVWAVRGLLA
jgi:Mn2+/Fe2+ NRAMP family transporter